MHAALTQETARHQKVQSKKERHKAGYSQVQTNFCRLRNALAALVVERDQGLCDLAEPEVDRDRLRSFLADPDDQVDRLQTEISNLESERDLALRDRDALQDQQSPWPPVANVPDLLL
uniref:Uncharacterized protein n=1 Tax=Peronospora matthiolae TaxID=2874970 RepID=A0AAV1U1J3_9STRA